MGLQRGPKLAQRAAERLVQLYCKPVLMTFALSPASPWLWCLQQARLEQGTEINICSQCNPFQFHVA